MFKSGPESLFPADPDVELSATSLAHLDLPPCHMLPTTTIMYKFSELVSQRQLNILTFMMHACLLKKEVS